MLNVCKRVFPTIFTKNNKLFSTNTVRNNIKRQLRNLTKSVSIITNPNKIVCHNGIKVTTFVNETVAPGVVIITRRHVFNVSNYQYHHSDFEKLDK